LTRKLSVSLCVFVRRFPPNDIDAAYYLMHSMSSSSDKFDKLESASAHNLYKGLTTLMYSKSYSGIVNEDSLSKHLASRKM
jgi:hypothetical protein